MKESNTKGITSHCGPESCGYVGNDISEALTGEPCRPGPAGSETRSMQGRHSDGKRDTRRASRSQRDRVENSKETRPR